MANWFFSSKAISVNGGLFITRVIVGAFMIYHGWEMFDGTKMEMYTGWFADRKYSNPEAWVIAGKLAELIAGIGFVLGLFTRLACIAAMAAFSGIIFLLGGKGEVFQGDQHPFLFVVIAFIFFFTGPGTWSADHLIFKLKR
ncbi:MAG: DoxX family protein [Chitinophagaceae bacterium]|nr:DoxX family protein [Chitinophagaceae bacterium]